MYFEYICWKFAGRLLDRVNTPLNMARQRVSDGRCCHRECATSRQYSPPLVLFVTAAHSAELHQPTAAVLSVPVVEADWPGTVESTISVLYVSSAVLHV